MKALDIAMRDLLRSFRSFFAIVFMFFVPLATVGIMYLAFGGTTGDSQEPSLPRVSVNIVNLDQAEGQGFAAGKFMVDFLTSDDLADLLDPSLLDDESLALQQVRDGDVGLAVIIPANLTAALFNPGEQAVVEIVHDPTLTLGPSIVEAILSQFLDAFNGGTIVTDVITRELTETGNQPDPALIGEISNRYTSWISEQGQALRAGESAYAIVQPVELQAEPVSLLSNIIGSVTAAMTVFYCFFTGSVVAQSTIREEEEGTLKRLFTTPLRSSTFLAGKVFGSLLTLVIQIAVLVGLSALVFGVTWGRPLPVILASIGLIALSSSFGIFLMSLVKSSNQVGVIYGGVMTITGLFGTYAYFLPISESISRYALFVPQGWAMNSLDIAMNSGPVSADLLVSVGVSLGLSAVFFLIGSLRFQRRFVIA